MPEAVLFDQDGVLIDSEGAWDEARRAIVAENGGGWKDGATRAMMGMSAPEWSRYVREELGVALDLAAAVLDSLDELSPQLLERLARAG